MTPRRIRTLTVTGTEGMINVGYTTLQITIENDRMITQPFQPFREPLVEELASFVRRVLADEEPEITAKDGLNALRVCEAAHPSAKTWKRISPLFSGTQSARHLSAGLLPQPLSLSTFLLDLLLYIRHEV